MLLGPALVASLVFSAVRPANAWDRGQTQTFAVLPNLPGNAPVAIEGLTVGPDGTVYTPTFGINAKGAVAAPPHLFSFRPDGSLLYNVALVNPAASPAPQPSITLLGLVYQASSKTLLICDLGQGIDSDAVGRIDARRQHHRRSGERHRSVAVRAHGHLDN